MVLSEVVLFCFVFFEDGDFTLSMIHLVTMIHDTTVVWVVFFFHIDSVME